MKKHNNIMCICITVSAVAMAAYIGLTVTAISSAIIFTTITWVFALIIAIMVSEMSKRYIENEFQKKMFMELEGQKGTESVRSEIDSVEVESLHNSCLSGV